MNAPLPLAAQQDLEAQEALARLDDAAAAPAMNAIRRIHPADLSPGVVKHLLSVLSNRVAASGWKHQSRAVAAVGFMDFAIAELEG